MNKKPILCLDFDGVLHSYDSGWQGADVVPDPPVPGAIEFLVEAVKHFRVCIYSSRSHQEGGIDAMQKWLHSWCDYDDYFVFDMLEWPDAKPSALVTLDDRAVTFTGTWPAMEQLLSFKPWNKLLREKGK